MDRWMPAVDLDPHDGSEAVDGMLEHAAAADAADAADAAIDGRQRVVELSGGARR
jgi:hypothetical protein